MMINRGILRYPIFSQNWNWMADENVAENDPIGYGSHFLLQQPDLTHVAWLDPKIHHTFKGMKLTSFP